MNDLTPKQERFIQNIVSGMSQRQAYKEAYQNNTTDKQADEEACKLFNSPKINQRYQELMEELKDKAIMTAKDRMIWLTEVIKDIQKEKVFVDDTEISKPADLNTKMKAMDILNKMDGQYTQKLEVDAESSFEVNIKVIE